MFLYLNYSSFFAIYIWQRHLWAKQGGIIMDKDSLPKLELDGFTSEIKKNEPITWKTKAAKFAQRAGIPVKTEEERKTPARPEMKDEDLKYRRLLIKTGICAAIAVVILGIASINSPAAETITDTIGETVNHEFDIDQDIGRLKFVDNLNDETQSVFSPLPDNMAVYPAEGEIVTAFGQSGSKGMRMDPVGTQVLSIAKGTVEYTGEIDGAGYLKVKLDSGETAYYYNVDPVVKADDIVRPGQQIGDLSGDYLYVEIKDGDTYVDPIAYIETWTAPVSD
jgi:murein DD-endopeptidase MepM/ murein hydrolase activator NlpD